ncbi:S41 family peptidase [Roseateles sp.]|uniref:S41 family peptidase n=1 Tax=Roseateles sp. TaxID=1971397 RepID=UPI003BA8B815
MKHLLLILCLLFTWGAARAAPELSADDARRDLRILQRALTDLHPGLYRYATPAQIAAGFTAANAAVAGGASRAQLYLLATRLAAAVRCGHTWTNPSNQTPATQALLGRQTLPLVLRFVEGRIRVVASASGAVPAGSELLAIEGQAPAQIAAALLPYLRADGGSDGKRLAQLDDDANGGAMQRLFPLLYPPGPEGWRLRLADGREVRAPALTSAERALALQAAGWRERDANWRLRIEADTGTAVLTLPTFAFWNRTFDGAAFLDRAFAELAERGIGRLVIDLRDNEGGDDALGRALLAHLIREPFTQPGSRRESAYERVPYALARYLDTWDFGFFDRTGQVTRTAGRNWAMPDSPPRVITPVARPFVGRVVALVGPQNSSAGYLLARDLKASGAATLLGQPTGGNLRGLNGGQIAWITLPASGVAVDIPLVASFAPGDPPDSGVQPDVVVPPRWADAVASVDTELAAALRWLAQ